MTLMRTILNPGKHGSCWKTGKLGPLPALLTIFRVEQLNSLSTPRIGVIQLFPILVKKGFSSTAAGFIEPYQVSSGVKLLYN